MGKFTEYKLKKQADTNSATKYRQFREREIANQASQYIVEQLKNYENSNSKFVQSYNDRFFDSDGKYISDKYRRNTQVELLFANKEKERLEKQRQELISLLDSYGSNFKEDWLQETQNYLNDAGNVYDKIIKTYSDDNDLFSQFENADEFYDWSEKQKQKETLRNTNLNSVKTEISDLTNALNNILSIEGQKSLLANQYDNLMYSSNQYPSAEGQTELNAIKAELDAFDKKQKELEGVFGSSSDIKKKLEELNKTYSSAKELQEIEALTTDALNASDFEKFAQKGSEWGNDTNFEFYGKDEGRGTYGFFNREKNDLISYYRNNLSSYEDEAKHMANGPTKEMEKAYHFAKEMTEDEYNIYAYYLGKGDTDSAKKYLDSIEQSITYRFAENFYDKNLKDANYLEQIVFALTAGTEQFQTGLENLFSDSSEFAPSYRQVASEKVREDLKDKSFNVWYNFKTGEWEDKINGSSIGQIGYDLASTTGNMLPSILTSAAVSFINPTAGQMVGSALMGASAKGNAYAEMINLGYNPEQASRYSTLVGASEAGLQFLLGGIGKLGGSVSSKAISSAVSKIDNVFARTAIQLGGNMLSEGAEEYIQEVLDPFFKNIAFGEDNDIRFISEDALYSGLLGALSAGVLEGGSTISSNVSTYRTGKQLKAAGVTAEQLSKLSVDSEAYKLAGRINENTGAYTIGRMFNELNAEITAQNKAEIKEALRAKGINPVSANSIANWMERVVAGEELTAKQKAALENNPVLGEVMRDVLYERNTTALQRQAGLDSIRSQLEEYQIKQALDKAVKKAEKKKAKNTANNTADTQDTQNTAQQAEIEDFGAEIDTSLAEDEKANEANPRVSDNGRTFSTKTGEDLDIVGIASVKEKTFKTADGQTVDSKDVSFATENEAVLFDSVLSMDLPTEIANAIIDGYIPSDNISVTDYLLGSNLAYRYGYAGAKDIELMLDSDVRNIPEHLSKGLYNLGRETAKAEASKEQAEIDSKKAQKSENKTKKKGRVTFDGKELRKEFEDSLTDIQRESIKGIKVIAEVLGNDINLFASYIAKEGPYKGKRVYKDSNGNVKLAPNGFYNPDGSINLDINSGNLGEGTILYTLSHELTHHIRKWSPAKFKVLADFVVEQYSDNGIKINDLVYEQMAKAKKNGKSISYGTAYEEVIADACSTMLLDSNAIEKLAQKDKTLFEKIKSFIKDFIDKINKLYKNFSPDAKEAQYVKDIKGMTDKLQALWFEGLEDASEAYSNAMGDSSLVNIDADSKSIAPMFSERTWTQSEYVTEREKTAKAISESLGVDIQTAYKYIDDINSVARLIADDRVRLDYEPNLDDKATVLKPNSDYKYTVDMSTLCAKRLVFTGTFDAIQKALPNTVFDSDDIVRLREMMMERGYEVACGICYVESTRREIGRITQDFIDSYKESQKTGKPITRTNSEGKIVELKKTNEQKKTTTDKATDKFYAEKDYTPTLGDLNTTDIGIVKREHPLVYEAYLNFMNARGQSKPKLLETRAEYKGEILKSFKSKNAVDARNRAGGLRLQSFSDFEVPHLIDMMQVVMDMSRVGLKSQAYTKVPKFAEAFGNTGVKINLSLIAKGSGLDSNGNLVFDDVEGINHKEAFKLREKFSKNVGTILVGKNNEHIIAAMADPRIDFIIPFHKSSWKESLYKALGLTGYEDYTETQHEKPIDKSRKISDFDPSEYWDYSKTGDENAQIYLQKCKEDGRTPKFPQFQNYRGYWKLLIDFKMYDNDGVGSPQEVVQPIFDSKVNEKILSEYKGGHHSFPVAKDVVKDFVEQHSNNTDTILYSDRDSDGNTLSKEQQEFFKDSKVRDKDGNLLVMYHGTANGGAFTIFDGDRLGNEARKTQIGQGFYFTNMKNEAEAYMKNVDIYGKVGKGSNPHLHQVYLNITNPFDINADQLDMQSVKAVYSEGTYDYFFSNWIPFYLNKKTVNGKMVTKAEIQVMSKSEKVSAYVDYLASLGTKEVLSNMVRAFPSEKQSELLSSMKKHLGYDGIVEEFSKGKYQYVAFSSEQVKNIDNKAPTADPDIRFSDRSLYTYESITSKPDMEITILDSVIPKNRADVVAQAKQKAAAIGKINKDGSVSVYVKDVNGDVILSKKGLLHGLDRRFAELAPITVKAGEIIKNSIKINEVTPSKQEADASYILIGVAQNSKGELCVVRSVINKFSNELDAFDVLYAINAKKSTAVLDAPLVSTPNYRTTISIAQLLNFVERYFPDILPESVLRHYGYNERPEGQIGENALYSERDPDGGFSKRYLLANALESTAKTAEDKKKLVEYKAKLGKLSEVQQRLQDVNAKIKEISFGKGKRDKVKLAELQKTSKELNDLINRYDKKLFSLESTESLKQVLEREKKAAYKKAAQEGKEALTNYREKAKQREQDIRTKYQESRQKSIEGREKTAMRHKIQKKVQELHKLYEHGTKERNVKIGLQKAVAEAIAAINGDTVKLEKLKEHYSDIIDNKVGEDIPAYFKQDAAVIEQSIKETIDKVGDTPLSKMNIEQLNQVYKLYSMVLTTIRNVNKLWRNNKLEDLRTRADAVMSQVSKLPALKEERGKKFGKVQEYIWNELIPIYAFETIGSEAFTELFWDSVEGMNTWAKDIEESLDFAEKTRKKYNLSSWDRNEVHSIKLESGKTMRLTLEHMMSIYAYSKRKQAEKHMTLGGFFFDSNETFTVKKGVHEVSKSSEASYKISLNDMQTITAKMNEVAKGSLGYVDEMQAYLTKMGEKGNEVSRVLWGIDIFTEKVYFPLKSKADFTVQPNTPVQSSSLKNDGMTKETVPNASNPIILQKFDDVWSNHVNRMSQYHGFVLPIENLNKVFGYGKWLDGEAKAVSTVIESRHGAAAKAYISKFIDDLNGNVMRDSVKNPLASFFTNVKKTTVAMSGSTVAQQPTAIIRAMALVNPKYFVHLPHLQDFRFLEKYKQILEKYELIKKHAPVAFVKEMGGFEAGSGRRVQDVINESLKIGWDKAKQKIDDITMFGAELGDVIGWCAIWDAVEREVQSQHKNVDVGSQEYFKLVGDRFTKVIVYTQVFDSTLSRSGFMRSNSEIMKMLTAYGGEPTVSVNMMYSAILKAKRGGSKWQSARTLGVVYASIIVAAAAASVYYALRDDDDDETFGEKFAEAWADKLFGGTYGLTGELNPLTQLPAIKDIISIFDGWDVERMDVAIFKDLKNAIDDLKSDNKSDWRKIEDFTGAIGAMFGIPVKNILRTGREIYNAFKMGYNSFFGDVESDGFWNAFGRGFSGEEKPKEKEKAKRNTTKYNNSDILEALEEGSLTTAAEMIEDLVAERTANYIEEDEELSEKEATKKAQASVRSAVTQHLKPLYVEAYQSKDQSKMRELRYLMRDLKIYGSVSDILSTCNNWVKESRKK